MRADLLVFCSKAKREITLKTIEWWIATATSLLFLLAAFSKAATGEGGLFWQLQIAMEAVLAIVASRFWNSNWIQLGFACLFSAFATYVLFVSVMLGNENCDCFAREWDVPPWAMLTIDITFAYAWYATFARRFSEFNVILRVAIIALFTLAVTSGGKTVLEERAYRLALNHRILSFSDNDKRLVQEASAIYFLKTRCGKCVAGPGEFENYCELNSLRYVVAVGKDALPLPEIKSSFVIFPTSENNFDARTPAHLISDGNFVAELQFDKILPNQ